jgi:hypothetical protein
MGVPYGSNAAYPIYVFTNPYHLRFLFSYNPYHAQLLFQFAPANNCVELMYLGCLTCCSIETEEWDRIWVDIDSLIDWCC